MVTISAANGQLPYSEDQFRAFDAKGKPVTMADIIKAAGNADAVFLGELHDDPVGHAIEAEVFRRVYADYSAKRKVTLSMEMFERDVQIIINEYLNSLITEKQFTIRHGRGATTRLITARLSNLQKKSVWRS